MNSEERDVIAGIQEVEEGKGFLEGNGLDGLPLLQ